jgi:MFS superfamily sulfate permease-like transporter
MWIFLLAILLGIVLFKLGILSVLVAVLELSLKATIGVIAGIGLLMIWIQHRKP